MPKRERLSNTASGDNFIRRNEKGSINEEEILGESGALDVTL